ncbi:MAG: hypothetical protein IKR92_04370 [Alphaproteobacteria bacterium]|nr:hypothetical protein [Alphaproteobacteria bacterium]
MKKTVILGAAILLSGCTCLGDCNKPKTVAPEAAAPEMVVPSVVQIQAAPCVEPMLLRPRVIESKSMKRRVCCDEKPCYQTADNDLYVPDLPEIYSMAANRTVNTMLVEAEPFFKQVGNIKVWIDTEYARSADLPGGMDKGTITLKKRFAQIPNVTVTDNRNEADYIVGSKADWFDTATKKVPAIKYDLFLKTPDMKTFGEWSEIIHQAEGDRSWW